jgi:hypothetical protein
VLHTARNTSVISAKAVFWFGEKHYKYEIRKKLTIELKISKDVQEGEVKEIGVFWQTANSL